MTLSSKEKLGKWNDTAHSLYLFKVNFCEVFQLIQIEKCQGMKSITGEPISPNWRSLPKRDEKSEKVY